MPGRAVFLPAGALLVGMSVLSCHAIRRLDPPGPVPMRSALVRADEGQVHPATWGQWRRRLRGDTAGTRDLALSLFTLAPGQAPHPPHRHVEEELMILVAGSGTWHLEGKESPARDGDVVYAAPWAVHGLRNTGTTPLHYYVLKWGRR